VDDNQVPALDHMSEVVGNTEKIVDNQNLKWRTYTTGRKTGRNLKANSAYVSQP